jgi:multidrug efflux pump subunit AcrA (membrane-fusion protein)
MYAHVTLDLVRHPDALRLPVRAVGALGASPFVFVVTGGRLFKKPVSTGINDGQYVEITSGLTGDELVVSAMRPTLRSGEAVEYVLPHKTNVAINPATEG